MWREEAVKELMKLFKENSELFIDTIEELDSYNGYLGDNRYYPMDMLPELYSGVPVDEVLRQVYFGHGESQYESFSPMAEYFTYNGYGNLVSSDEKDYSDFLDEWFIDSLIENANHLNLDSEVQDIIDTIS